MTTYQDPPLHSRRAARQGERAEAENAESSAERAIAAGTAEPLNYATTSRPPLPQYDGQSLRPRRTVDSPVESQQHADLPPTEALPDQDPGSYRTRDYSPEGRRSAAASVYGGVGDDGTVEFHTQARENVPTPVTESFIASETPVAEPAAPESEAAAPSPTVAEHAEYTMTRRELRALREAGVITDVTDLSQPIQLPVILAAPETPLVDEALVETGSAEPESAEPAELAAAEMPTSEVPAAEAPAAEAPATAPEAEVAAAVAPIADPIPLVPPAPQQSTRLDSALAEFDALASGREPLIPSPDAPAPLSGRRAAAPLVVDEPVEAVEIESAPESEAPSAAELFPQPEPLPPSTEGLSAFDALFQPPSASIPVVVALPVEADAAQHDVVEAQLEPETAADQLLAAPAPQGAPALVPPPPAAYPTPVDLPAPPATQSPVQVPPTPFPVTAPPVAQVTQPPAAELIEPNVAQATEPTVGHWSTQADIDDAEQISDSTISRSVGAGNGAITTSALVLPSVPDHAIGGPMGDGGEILLTGSISLPDSLSATGAHPSQLDESDLDHLLDPGDHQVAATDSTPVRAIRAVSTHTASGVIISPSKPKGTRGFTILIIAASAMAVVVVGLLIAGLVSGTL